MEKRFTARIFLMALVAAEAEGGTGAEPMEGEAEYIQKEKGSEEKKEKGSGLDIGHSSVLWSLWRIRPWHDLYGSSMRELFTT
jgi:hypothetical protein